MRPILVVCGLLVVAGLTASADAFEWEYLAMDGVATTCIEADPYNLRVFVGTHEGFHFLDQATGVWTERDDEDWIGRQVYAIAWHRYQDQRVITGRENAFFKGYLEVSDDLGETGDVVYQSTGGAVSDLAGTVGTFYACTWPDVVAGEFLRSEDDGETWTPLTGHGQFAMTAIAAEMCGVYLAGDAGVVVSWDEGQTWEPTSNGLPAGLVHCVISAYGGGDVVTCPLFASTDEGLYFSDMYIDWQQVLPYACRNLTRAPVAAPWPGAADVIVAVTFDGRVMVSRDFGTNWDDETGDLPGTPLDIAYSPLQKTLYVCTAADGVYRVTNVVTAVAEPPAIRPIALRAWPNPFNPRVRIGFTLPQEGQTTMRVYDLGGRLIATLLDAWCDAGDHQLQWDATALPSGTYLARLHGGFGSRTVRLTLTR